MTDKQSSYPKKNTGFRFNFASIRVKLIATFLSIIIPISILAFISYNVFTGSMRDYALKSAFQTTRQLANHLNHVFDTIEETSLRISINENVRQYLLDTGENAYEFVADRQRLAGTVRNYINDYALAGKFISNISILANKNDFSIGTLNFQARRLDFEALTSSGWYSGALEKNGDMLWMGNRPELDNAFLSAGAYSASTARKIKEPETGRKLGMVVIDISANALYNLIMDVDQGTGSLVYLVSPDGRIISSVSEHSEPEKSDGITEVNGNIIYEEFYTNLLSSPDVDGSGLIVRSGYEYLMSYSKLNRTGYTLVSLIPMSELLGDVNRLSSFTILFGSAAVLISLLTGLYMSGSMGRAIKNIMNTAEQAAAGNLTVKSQLRRNDELGKLSFSINVMLENIRQLIHESSIIVFAVSESSSTVSSVMHQFSHSSDEISKSMQEVAKGSSEQASESENSVKIMDELSKKMSLISKKSENIAKLSESASSHTEQGMLTIDNLELRTKDTSVATKSIIDDIRSLEEKSESIGKITDSIEHIAKHTNLLALNAAIEAARAGREGQGFAIVAQEVRKLAEQSMLATKEIGEIIKTVLNQTATAVRKAKITESTLDLQIKAVNETKSSYNQISSSMKLLSEDVQMILLEIGEVDLQKTLALHAIQNISALSQQFAASSQEVASSAEEQLAGMEEMTSYTEELNKTAERLKNAIRKFKLN